MNMFGALVLGAGGVLLFRYIALFLDFLLKSFGVLGFFLFIQSLLAVVSTYISINYDSMMVSAIDECNPGRPDFSCVFKSILDAFMIGSVWTLPILSWLGCFISVATIMKFGLLKKDESQTGEGE
jgi:hypothetical protein